MRRGAATDLMEQVGDALAAPRSAPVAGGRSKSWWIEKGVRDKKCRSVRWGAKSQASRSVIPRDVSVPDHTRPEDVDRVGGHISPRGAKAHGVSEAHGKYL